MVTNLEYINQICLDLGGVGSHVTNLAGENEICTLLGGTGGHVTEIAALNEICTIQGVAAGHSLVLSALNAIAGVTRVTNLDAWKYIQNGTLLNYNPATDDDLNFRSTERSGLSLVDSVSAENAAVLLPCVKITGGSGATAVSVASGITPQINTVWAFKGHFNNTTTASAMGAVTSGASMNVRISGTPKKYELVLGNQNAYGSNADTNWHLFVFYNKKFWVSSPDNDMSDASILNVINTEAPNYDGSAGSFGTGTQNIYYGYNPSIGVVGIEFTFACSFLGTITAGAITWQRKHIFNNPYYVYDLLSDANFIDLSTVSNPAISPIEYSSYGFNQSLEVGHTKCVNAANKEIDIPYLVTANINTRTMELGWVNTKDVIGISTKHNLADSLIEFQGDLWDRSSETIYAAAARAVTTYYDAANPKRWHVSELNALILYEWLNTDYRGMWFVKVLANSVDEDERLTLDEIFSFSVNKTGTDFDKVLKYTNDYSLVIL